MHGLAELLVLLGVLLGASALIQVLAVRLGTPEATLLSLVGIALGAGYASFEAMVPQFAQLIFDPLLEPAFPANAYLWLFLPPLLFQVALSVDVRSMLRDAAPILLLAVVAVFVATGVIGLVLGLIAPYGWVACLLLGAIVATTDPSAVAGIFRDVGAPARLINLVEGESLLNDAAAIAVAAVLLAMLTGQQVHAEWWSGLRTLGWSFAGGLLLGALAGRLVAFMLPWMRNLAAAETALTMALPYPLYLLASEVLEVSGVVAVVAAAIVVNALGRTRLRPRNWNHLQLVWEQIAVLAGAIVFLLAALRVPGLMKGAQWSDVIYVAAAVVAALVARMMVLFLMLPALGWLKLSKPVSPAYRLAIAWGGLRGAVTLVLALGVSQHAALPLPLRQFVANTATGFVLFSLLVNGGSLRWVIHRLGLDRLSPQNQALQQQAIRLSTEEVEATVRRIAGAFAVPQGVAEDVNAEYRRDMAMGAAALDLDSALSERERLAIGLVTLALRERDLVPEYGDGVSSVANLDAMMLNTGRMIEAARSEGRIGYNRVAREIQAYGPRYHLAVFLHRWLKLDRPLERVLTDRFELLSCRRAVVERLRAYNHQRLTPLFGERLAGVLDSVLATRVEFADEGIRQMRARYGEFTAALERRLLLLFAVRQGRASMEAMVADRVISREVYNWVRQELDEAWRSGVERPSLSRASFRPAAAAHQPVDAA